MPTIPTLLHSASPALRDRLLRSLPEHQLRAMARSFPEWAHAGQLPPAGDWRTWVIMAGRGFGKTRAGAEWVLDCVRAHAQTRHPGAGRGPARKKLPRSDAGLFGLGPGLRRDDASVGLEAIGKGSRRAAQPLEVRDPGLCPSTSFAGPPPRAGEDLRIALVAATINEARAVMVEGPSGILACAGPNEIADWLPSRGLLKFASGAEAALYSGASPNALRGPQHHLAWCDELAKWRHPLATWDMLQFGLRCGPAPRALVTTTPRGGCAALAEILAAPDTVQTGGATSANPHLPPAFLSAVTARYGGTRLGREELDGEFLSEITGSLWPLALLDASRGAVPAPDALRRVVVAVDPPTSAAGTCGIVACGLDAGGVAHVLADCSAEGLSPEGWASAVAAAAELWSADRVVAEKNQGGDMVRSVLRSAGLILPLTLVSATRSKVRRAEPVAGLFESGRAKLAGRFPELEAQLGGLVAGGDYMGPGKSPDRADAMVWALHALVFAVRQPPRVLRP